MISRTDCGVSTAKSSGYNAPCSRTIGGAPAVRWRSEALRSITSRRTSAKSKSIGSPYRQWERSRDPCDLSHGRDAVLDLLEAVVAQRAHALIESDSAHVIGRRPFDR